jgi:hypothetical protein
VQVLYLRLHTTEELDKWLQSIVYRTIHVSLISIQHGSHQQQTVSQQRRTVTVVFLFFISGFAVVISFG